MNYTIRFIDFQSQSQPMKTKTPILSVTIKDCIVETYCASGPGGQHRNATKSAVRVKHPPSGAMAESCETRSQHENKRLAFKRMAQSKEMQLWLKMETAKLMGKPPVDQLVDEAMQEKNLKVEIKENGKWTPSKKTP